MAHNIDLPPVPVVRDPSIPISHNLLHPHYDDPRFRVRDIGRVVFLAPDVRLDDTGHVEGAEYMDSDKLLLWHKFADFRDGHDGEDFALNSADYFQAALDELWPRLHKNYSGIVRFGRGIPGVKLQAITSGINGFNLNSFNQFAVVPRSTV